MAEELRQSSEKLRAVADITHALAVQMGELLKLREAVQKAEEAMARRRPKQRHREIIVSAACCVQADAAGIGVQVKPRLATQRGNQVFSRSVAPSSDVISPEHLDEARIRKGTAKKALPGRLFMQSQWR